MGTKEKLPVLCIAGPTATGKSDLGIAVAKAVGGEVLSADSMQVYRKMDIGTAKVRPEEMMGVPHHLLNLVNPDEDFSAAQWVHEADRVIRAVCERGNLPIVVGGTGLYIRAIVENLDFGESARSDEIRDKWERFARQYGNVALHKILEQRDPITANRLHPNDVRRVIRALEVMEVRKSRLSETYDWRRRGGRYEAVQFGLTMQRQELYSRVERRIDAMLSAGLLREVESLLTLGYSSDLISMQAIGYKELTAYFYGLATLDEAISVLKRNTRRFVKRQLSWFQRDERIQWLTAQTEKGVSEENFSLICAVGTRLKAGIPNAKPE